jgi:hypothetical protein
MKPNWRHNAVGLEDEKQREAQPFNCRNRKAPWMLLC